MHSTLLFFTRVGLQLSAACLSGDKENVGQLKQLKMLPLLLWNLRIIVKRIFAIDIGLNSYPDGASQKKVVLSYHQSQVYVLIEKITDIITLSNQIVSGGTAPKCFVF